MALRNIYFFLNILFAQPPKKKLSKKEKARLEAEQAEMLRLEMEREKLKKLEEARQRRKVEREQAKRRLQLEIQENKQRRAQLKNSMAFFHQIRDSTEAIKMSAKNQNDWEKFMRCNGLPNSNSPSDLRKYIHQWQIDIERRNRESRNWLLKTNERTLLTQDTNVPDLTKATLRKQQGNLGDVYAQRVTEILGILLELDEVLGDKQKPSHTLTDLSKLKTEIRVLLKDYLDDFTHKIMSHIERDMEIDRSGVSKHIYESEVFKSFIWTFSKDAQISLCAKPRIGDQNLHNEIDFPLIEMQISLPPTVSLYSSALRGLWLNYDHFSDYCPSFKLKKPRPDYINMLTQTKKEWRKRKEILQNMLDECSKEVPLTELEQFEHERDLTSQQAREKSLDVDKLYLEYEDELNKLRRRAIGPEGFGLTDTDVNLRKYRIIGGVYGTDYLETPQQDKQLNARSFIRTIFAPNKLLHKNYYQTFKPPPPPQPGVRRLPEEIEAEMRMVEAALDKLALVTVQLPDSVIWFEPPIACRWETQIETLESDLTEGVKQPISSTSGNTTDATPLSTTTNLSPLKSLSPRFPASKLRKKSSQKSIASNLPVREVIDFDMFQMSSDIDIYGLLKDFIVPRLPQGFSVSIDTSRLKQLQLSKRKLNKNKQNPPKVLFLARPKNVCITPTPTITPETLKHAQLPPKIRRDLQTLHKTRITEDFLDFDEPKEFFPSIHFDKVLKIKPLDKANKQQEFKLNLKTRNSNDVQESMENMKSISRDDSKGSLVSMKSSKSSSSHGSTSRRSSEMSDRKQVAKTYMFSQLIEDLDRLCELQTPVQQEELLQQISENLMGKNNTTINGKDVSCDDAEAAGDEGESKAAAAEATSTLTDVMQQPAALVYYSGISFVRDSETFKTGEEADEDEENAEEDDEETSTDEEEYDDDDYEDYFLNENLDNEAALTSYRSETSGGTSGVTAVAATTSSGKEAGIHDFLNKHSHSDTSSTGDGISDKGRSAPNKIFNATDERYIVRKIRQNPKLSAPKLATEVKNELNKTCSAETIRRVLRKHDFNGRVARKKPFINKKNQAARLKFAKEHINKDSSFWEPVIFADESKFNIFGSDGQTYVWRKPNTELQNQNLKPTVKHGGGSVMVWACMSSSGVGNLQFIETTMNKDVYLDILKANLLQSAEKLGIRQQFRFYQDNDPKHKAGVVQSWLIWNCPHLMQPPAQSPDLNVIENLWAILDQNVRQHQISNRNDLIAALKEEWAKITPKTTSKCSIVAVIAAEAGDDDDDDDENVEDDVVLGKWSTRDVHDTKFNEDKLSIQFRTGRMGIFGFALNRYSNMPYQTWEIKPDLKCPENILFSFTASLVSLDITITSQGFCVNNFQGGSTASINEMIGKTLSLDAIKQILISSAVDIFPDEDAFCYTEGSCEKNYVMEMHLYACMSTLSLSHNFSWSRWNLLAGSRTAVLLLRELVDGKKVPNHSTLLVTPLKTAIIECTEVSASFNSQGIAGMDYYADLYQLAQVHAQPSSLEKQRNMNPELRDNVATILMAIRPLSFC
ncbi:uncharacterized protein LOC135956697 [Calliphora vicina]|uniref:uncharacterized protein LOC135956697 n=1 Tax=Calliphora vicina TaxID=7373 RepID=UPI00325B08BE